MKKFLIILLLSLPVFAGNLQLKEGFVAAHTEVFGDSTIDPLNNDLRADLTMQDVDITTLRGSFSVDMKLFVSDNSDRDENMNEATEVSKFPLATYTVSSVTQTEDAHAYIISGTLDFHGTKNGLDIYAEITWQDNTLTINGISKILLSDYKVEAPCLLGFLCVEDKVDIFAKAVLSK
ncbi:YceI family protein [Campylobacterota bacterium]